MSRSKKLATSPKLAVANSPCPPNLAAAYIGGEVARFEVEVKTTSSVTASQPGPRVDGSLAPLPASATPQVTDRLPVGQAVSAHLSSDSARSQCTTASRVPFLGPQRVTARATKRGDLSTGNERSKGDSRWHCRSPRCSCRRARGPRLGGRLRTPRPTTLADAVLAALARVAPRGRTLAELTTLQRVRRRGGTSVEAIASALPALLRARAVSWTRPGRCRLWRVKIREMGDQR